MKKSKASRKKATVNLAIDSRVLEEDFHKINADLGCVTWDYKVFLAILDLVQDESKIVDILWNDGSATVKSYFNHNNISSITKENIIKHIYEHIGLWTGQYSLFSHYTDSEGYTCLVFDHKFGIKWSRILASLHSRALDHWLGLKTAANITSKTVVLKILERY